MGTVDPRAPAENPAWAAYASGVRSTTYANGVRSTTYANGVRSTTYANGVRSTTVPSTVGYCSMISPSGTSPSSIISSRSHHATST